MLGISINKSFQWEVQTLFIWHMNGAQMMESMTILWRRKWKPTPLLLCREFRGQRSLVGCCLQGHTESDMTEATQHACMHQRRKWQPTPLFLPGESQGQRSLVGCHLWGCTELDMTEATQHQQQDNPQSFREIVFK